MPSCSSTPQLTPSDTDSISDSHQLNSTPSRSSTSLLAKKTSGFEIPIFRHETQKNLKFEILTERDRRYIIRTLATMLLSTVPHPSMSDCAIPAKALIQSYPLLAHSTEENHMCVNVNRGESDEKRPKRAKMEVNKGKHLYLDDVQSIVVDDEVSFDRNFKKLFAEAQKKFDRITGLSNSMEKFVMEWKSSWMKAILNVSKEEGFIILPTIDDSTDDDDDLISLGAFKHLIKLTTSKRKKDTLLHILLSVKSGTPHDEIVGISNQPMIVSLYDSEDPSRNNYYIMVEQELLQETRSFKEAIFLLVAIHYIFN
uniref:Uncharacterized protein n=1 Tax=Amphimedon queenslandica TaxID=400682 RepID=A0A1X7V755_AMPQE